MNIKKLSHLNEYGHANMVNISPKNITQRTAVAEGKIYLEKDTINLIASNLIKKGDVISIARIAGIIGAKNTFTIIPLCHQVPLDSIEIDINIMKNNKGIEVSSTCICNGKTGVEMEALVSVSISCLTIYDMVKSVDRSAIISDIKLIEKSGGKSGHYKIK
jgi:cyclic pyranopterin monophosphate synthase